MHHIGLDIHKKTIAFCCKKVDGTIVDRGIIPATRSSLTQWLQQRKQPWAAAMEATMFTGWVYDFMLPHCQALKVAHPQMLKAITTAKKKNDRDDAERIADLLRCNLLPECYIAPAEVRDLRRVLRYRNLLVREAVKMKNKTSGLLMEVGAPYDKQRLHRKGYFAGLIDQLDFVPDSVIQLLKICRMNIETFDQLQNQLTQALVEHPDIAQRVQLLMTIPGVGKVSALTWILEIGDISRFSRISQLVSYCGLCSAQNQSAGKDKRGPISKKRNKHLQTILVEAAKIAPRWNRQLAEVHERELCRGHRNRATLAVARKLVAYMFAVDRTGEPFIMQATEQQAA